MATLQPIDGEFPIYPSLGGTPPPAILTAPIPADPIVKTVIEAQLKPDGSILQALLDLRQNLQKAPTHSHKVYPAKLRGQFLGRSGAPLGGILVTTKAPQPPVLAPKDPLIRNPPGFDAMAWMEYSDLTDDRGVFNVTL